MDALSVYSGTNTNVCTHLTLGLCPCTTTNETSYSTTNKKRKLEHQATNVARKNEVERRSWGYSTELMLYDDPWKIKKVLKKSDLGNLSRVLVGTELAEKLVKPVLGFENVDGDNGIQVRIWDVDTNSMHTPIFKKWVTSKSHIFMGKWKRDFVVRRGLKEGDEGDEIGFHWDPYNNHFNFSLLHVANH